MDKEMYKYFTVTGEKKRDNKRIPGGVHVNSNIPWRKIHSSAEDNSVYLFSNRIAWTAASFSIWDLKYRQECNPDYPGVRYAAVFNNRPHALQ